VYSSVRQKHDVAAESVHVGVRVLGSASLRRADTQEPGLVGCLYVFERYRQALILFGRTAIGDFWNFFVPPPCSDLAKGFVFSPCDWSVALVKDRNLKL